jgi:hypothetical protein
VVPVTSVLLTIVAELGSAASWFWLSRSLMRMSALVVAGKVNRAIPVRCVAVSSVWIWPPLLFAEKYPAVATSVLWSYDIIVPLTLVGALPVIGSTGSSPIAPQPGPARFVNAYPRSEVSLGS